MTRLEIEAARVGKMLLTLDTRAGDAAENLYRSMGWHEAGRIPGYALNAERTPCDTIFFWKTIDQPSAVPPDRLRSPRHHANGCPIHGYRCYARSRRSSRAQRRSKFRDAQPFGHAGRGPGHAPARLAWTLGWLDIKLRYRGSMLGPFWLTLSTGIMVGSLGVLYSTLFHMNMHEYLPFLSLSLVLWGFLSCAGQSNPARRSPKPTSVDPLGSHAVLRLRHSRRDPQCARAGAQHRGDRRRVRRLPDMARLARLAGDSRPLCSG